MPNPSAERNPAEPSPDNPITFLGEQCRVAQPVADLQEHHPQIGLHRHRRTLEPGSNDMNGAMYTGTSSSPSTRPNSSGNTNSSGGNIASHIRQLVIYSSKHDGLDPFSPKGSRPSSRQTTTRSATATPRLFQVEVARGCLWIEASDGLTCRSACDAPPQRPPVVRSLRPALQLGAQRRIAGVRPADR